MKTNDGSYLQDKLAKVLKDYSANHKGLMHRFPDTKSAGGNFLQAQPGDFFFLVPQGSILIECKSTVANATLLSLAWHGKVGKNQIAKHRLWQRSGHPSLYLFGNLTEGERKATFEWHHGINVINKKYSPLSSGRIPELGGSIPDLLNNLKDC
jgi:hypothetical protein